MKKPLQYENPEPIPSTSQLIALPFVAAIAGYLVNTAECDNVRVTLHRVMTRDEDAYLQQACSYTGGKLDHTKAGRLFIVDEGIIGKAFRDRVIVRTGRYEQEADWWQHYREDRMEVGEQRPELKEPISYLALPFLNASGASVVCILYVEAGGLNRFTDGPHLNAVHGMCAGYCRVLDELAIHPLPRVRNYPLPIGKPVGGVPTIYTRLQEIVSDLVPPRFYRLNSFNFAPAP